MMQELHAAVHTMEVSAPAVEPMREDEEEERRGRVWGGRRKGSSSTDDLAPRQVPARQ